MSTAASGSGALGACAADALGASDGAADAAAAGLGEPALDEGGGGCVSLSGVGVCAGLLPPQATARSRTGTQRAGVPVMVLYLFFE
jgi:hypothetical protein